MNILYVSDSTTVSGAEIVMLGYIDALRARGHQACAFIHGTNARLHREFGARGVKVFSSSAYSRRIIRSTANPVVLLEFSRSFAAVAREMTAVIKAERIDLIHAISYPACLYAAFAAGITGIRQVWHEHNIKRLHSMNRTIYRMVSATCTWVIGPSDAVTGNLANAGIRPAKLRTVYNGIDLRKFAVNRGDQAEAVRKEFGLTPRSHAVGLFGQMLPYKGHSTLISAAPAVLEHHPATRFFLVGALENPPYEQRLRDEIAARGLTDRFHFTGWRADVQDIIRAMDVVVVGTTTPEPAALALMESMAMQRALVATNTGGTPEIVLDGRTGLLYPPGDAEQLARHIVRLLGDPPFSSELGRAGRERVERNFSYARHLDEMFDLYERAVAR